MKLCTKCNLTKSIDAFHLDTRSKDGLQTRCKLCRCSYTAKWQQDKKKENPTAYYKRRKSNNYRSKYGIDLGTIETMLHTQNNKCLICSVDLNPYVVDHCHTTGKVRGLLCSHCNIGLGNFMDNPTFLKNAIKYLHDSEIQ